VLAGPGAGKTQLLVDLYADLVGEGRAGRGEILVLTFSTAAAEEIAGRVDARLHDSYDQAWISTFHSFCLRLLRAYRPGPERVLLSGFQEQVAMHEVLGELDGERLGNLAAVTRSGIFAQDALAFVALLKQNRVPPAELALLAEVSGTDRVRALGAVYSAYQARLQAAGLWDFRDLVGEAIGLLEARPDVLAQLRSRFRYVLVDEFQDVDPAQFELLRTLAPPADRPRLLVVGDPDQSIYGFRGTVPGLLSEDFPAVYGGRSVALERSHRCPADPLAAARRVLASGGAGGSEGFTGEHAGWEPSVQTVRETDQVDEAAYVAREIRRLLLERPDLRPRDIAVLLRSTTSLAAPFEEAIRALDVPYEVRGVGAVGRNEVVRFLLSYLRALQQPDEEDALERLLGSALAGVGHRAAGRLRRHAVEEGRAFPRVVRRLLRWLHQEDPGRYPLPWPTPASTGEAGGPSAVSAPDYAGFLDDQERDSIHRAVRVFYELRGRARRLPLQALAYSVLLETGLLGRIVALPARRAPGSEGALPQATGSDEGPPQSTGLEGGPQQKSLLGDLRKALDAFGELEAVWERLHGAPPLLADVGPQLDALVPRAADEAEPASSQGDAVQIMTVHQSKGLEFEVVFLSGFARGIFPLAARPHPVLEPDDQRWLVERVQGFRPSWPADAAAHQAEEARLAHVGMTRAAGRLYLTYADEYDSPAGASPFLEGAAPPGPELVHPRAEVRLEPDQVLTLSEAETLLAGCEAGADARDRLRALGVDVDWIADPDAGLPFLPHLQPATDVRPGYFSPTGLNDYLKCPRLYFYNHHPGLTAPPRGVELERGSFLHRVLEDFHARESEWREQEPQVQRDWLEQAVQPHLQAYLDRVEAVLERRREEQEVRRILANYIDFATRSQPVRRLGTLQTEKRFFLDLDGAEVRGKIDRIIDTGDGTCEVVDYKTGRGSGIQRTYDRYFGPDLFDIQLVMYYLACQEAVDGEGRPLALRPRFLSVWYPKDAVYGSMRQSLFPLGGPALGVRDKMQHPVSDEDLARGRAQGAQAIQRIQRGDFSPAPRSDTIGTCLSYLGCPHAAVCPFGGGPAE
jgi:superfamily I DNA/RNA helicase